MSPLHPSPLRSALSLLALVFLCAACSAPTTKDSETPAARTAKESRADTRDGSAPAVPLDKAQQELASGIASYENGTYKTSARQLQAALTLGLEAPGDQAKAHKYLAFMHCVSQRSKPCRDEFAKALAADPAFNLTPAEAGHPSWGPVFRKLKAAGKPATK